MLRPISTPMCTQTSFSSLVCCSQIDANRSVDEVYDDVYRLFGDLPKVEKRKKKSTLWRTIIDCCLPVLLQLRLLIMSP